MKKADIFKYALAGMIVLGVFILVGMMYFIDIPEKNVGPLNQLIGALAAGFGVVASFFFGSSLSSQKKDDLIAKRREEGEK